MKVTSFMRQGIELFYQFIKGFEEQNRSGYSIFVRKV